MTPRNEDRFSARLFAAVALGLLGFALFRIFEPFFGPILWALLLALLFEPVNWRLKRLLGGRAGMTAVLLTLAAALCVAIPAVLLTVAFSRQAAELLDRVSSSASQYHFSQPSDVFQVPFIARMLEWLEAHLPVTAAQIQEWSMAGARKALQVMASSGRSLVLGVVGVFLNLVLTLFLLFFFLRDGREAASRLVAAIPFREDHKKRLTEHLVVVTKAVVFGTLITAVIQGTLVGIGFAIVGFPSPVVFGVVAAGLSLLPVGGTALIWGPGAIVLAAQGRWGWAVGLALYGALLVGMVDNLLKPLFISGKAAISTLPVFFGVLGGLAAFGPIGMFLGPVVIALGLALLRFAEESKVESRESRVEGASSVP